MSKLLQVREDDVVSPKIKQSIVHGNHGNCGCRHRHILIQMSVCVEGDHEWQGGWASHPSLPWTFPVLAFWIPYPGKPLRPWPARPAGHLWWGRWHLDTMAWGPPLVLSQWDWEPVIRFWSVYVTWFFWFLSLKIWHLASYGRTWE